MGLHIILEMIKYGTTREFNITELRELIQGKKGDQYEITVSTRLPLIEGNYNITLVASTPVIENRTALFLDYIENASVFYGRRKSTVKIMGQSISEK